MGNMLRLRKTFLHLLRTTSTNNLSAMSTKRNVSLYHERMPDALFNNLTAQEAGMILEHDEHLSWTARVGSVVVFSKANNETEAKDITKAILAASVNL